MFFIFGINSKRDNLGLNDLKICNICGSYGRYEAFVEYNSFSLFFMPIFKWGKKYYVEAQCCGSIFSISEELGKDIERGKISSIKEEDLKPIYSNYRNIKSCINCGYQLEEGHIYCPKCGIKN